MAEASAPSQKSAGSNVPGTIPASWASSLPSESAGPSAIQNAACRTGFPRQMSAMQATNAYTHSASGRLNSIHPGSRIPATTARADARAPSSDAASIHLNTRSRGERHSRYTAEPRAMGSTTCHASAPRGTEPVSLREAWGNCGGADRDGNVWRGGHNANTQRARRPSRRDKLQP